MRFSTVAAAAARKSVRIQYASDLHIECYTKAVFPLLVKPAARYLALCGNIGRPGDRVYTSFLSYVSHNWDGVLYVPGRTELCAPHPIAAAVHPSWDDLQRRLDAVEAAARPYTNIHVLTGFRTPVAELGAAGIAMVGSTLWCNGPLHSAEFATLNRYMDYYRMLHTPVCALSAFVPNRLVPPASLASSIVRSAICKAPVRAWLFGGAYAVTSGIVNTVHVATNSRGTPKGFVEGFNTAACHQIVLHDTDDTNRSAVLPELAAAAAGFPYGLP